MVPVEVLDEHDDVQAQSQNDGMDLDIAKVSLRSTCKQYEQRLTGGTLACLRVERKSIIFCTARVPCMLSEIVTRS